MRSHEERVAETKRRIAARQRKELFKSIYVHKEDVEKIMGFALDWRELPERKASRIIIEKPADLDDQAAWPEQFDYIKDVCTKMKKAFKKYI